MSNKDRARISGAGAIFGMLLVLAIFLTARGQQGVSPGVTGTAGNGSNVFPIGLTSGAGGAFTNGITYGGIYDSNITGIGTDGATKISSLVNDSTKCPNTANGTFPSGTNIGCIIDARNPTSSSDLVWKINPFHGPNKSIAILLGEHTYVACVPIVTGQAGYMIFGTDGPAQIPGGTRIRPGSAADGCPGTFPNGASQIVMTWQHGLYPAGTYASLWNDCGDPSTDSPTGVAADCFGGEIWHVQFDASSTDQNPTTVQPAANFLYFSGAIEERGLLSDVAFKNCITACAFFDRNFQSGPPSPGGSGPVHFTMRDIVMTERTDGVGDLVTDGLVAELNTTRITFSGQSGCSETTNPTSSNQPAAYITFNGGNPNGSATVTNGGNCSTPPSACAINGTGGSGATCALTLTGGTATPVLTVTITCTGTCATNSNYPTSSVPGGGPLLERFTIAGSDATHRFRNAIAIEGDRDSLIEHIHTERIGNPGTNPGSNGDTILHGFGTAPYSGGAFIAVNTTTGTGGCVHQGVGALSSDYFMGDITREISSGCVIVDDNIISNNTAFSLNTTDTPSHRRVGVYTGLSQNVIAKVNTINACAAVGTAASPSAVACGAASSGSFSCDVAASAATCVVSTTQVTANSQIIISQTAGESAKLSVTCNSAVTTGAYVSARSAGSSFTVHLPTFTTNPECFEYQLLN